MRIIAGLFVGLFITTSPVLAEPRVHCSDQPENLQTYLDIHKVLFMERDTTRVEEFYADKIISHNNDDGGPGSIDSSDIMIKMWEDSKKNIPVRLLEDELILCSDDCVVVRTTITSQDNTPLDGYEPTGKEYKTTAIDIYRFEDGKVVERWGNADLMHVYRQLGFKLEK